MKNYKLLSLTLLGFLFIMSCAKDPDALSIVSILGEGTSLQDGSTVNSDLNGVTSAEDVPVNTEITITFDRAVDASTVNDTNVKLTNGAGEVVITATASSATIKIKPADVLERGTQHTISLQNILAEDGGTLTSTTRTFTTEGRAPIVVPHAENQIAYWTFDGITDDMTGDYPADNVVAINFGTDRYGQGNSTATFDGDKSIIEVLDGDRMMDANDITISFWIKTNSIYHLNENGDPSGHFVFGLGAFFGFQFEIPADYSACKLALSYVTEAGTPTSEDLWFNGNGEDKDNGGWQGWDYVANLTGSGGVQGLLKDKWAHIVCTYDAESKRGMMFINGEIMKSQDFNLWPEADAKSTITGIGYQGSEPDVENILAIGFIKSIDSQMWETEPWGGYQFPTSNHFKGDLDDFRVFNAPFSIDDAKALYDAEKN
jgi:hypothetical protein